MSAARTFRRYRWALSAVRRCVCSFTSICRARSYLLLPSSRVTQHPQVLGPQGLQLDLARLWASSSIMSVPDLAYRVLPVLLHAPAVLRGSHAPLPIDPPLTAPAWPWLASPPAAFKRMPPAD